MTAQNVFPKVDGDILYASEINNFNSTRFLGAGSSAIFLSGVPYVGGTGILGSILIPANTIKGNPYEICFSIYDNATFSPGSDMVYLTISGPLSNHGLIPLDDAFVSSIGWHEGKFLLGSPFRGVCFNSHGVVDGGGGQAVYGEATSITENITNEQDLVIFMIVGGAAPYKNRQIYNYYFEGKSRGY